MPVNLMSGPIPGQSLTAEPGSRPWEQPAQFTNEDDAMEYLIPRLFSPKSALAMADLMEQGVPATAITDTLLMSGFAEGKWTPDLAVLIALPAYEAVKKAVELTGKKVVTGLEDKYTYKPDETLMDLARKSAEDDSTTSSDNALIPPVDNTEEMPMEQMQQESVMGPGIMGGANG